MVALDDFFDIAACDDIHIEHASNRDIAREQGHLRVATGLEDPVLCVSVIHEDGHPLAIHKSSVQHRMRSIHIIARRYSILHRGRDVSSPRCINSVVEEELLGCAVSQSPVLACASDQHIDLNKSVLIHEQLVLRAELNI